jgi:inner membrane protein
MDGVTQGLLGAAVGQAVYQGRLGRRAAAWGAVGGIVPDLDILATLPMGAWGEMLYHRGVTHSLGFGPVVGPILGYALWRAHGRRPGELGAWIGLFVLALVTHPLLDLFTTYGTQLLAPMSDRRFALDAVAIIDPAYSLLLLAALLVGGRVRPRAAAAAAGAALLLSSAYLFYALALNVEAERYARRQLEAEGSPGVVVRSYPTLLQPYLRRIVARDGSVVRVGHLSLWRPHRIEWSQYEIPRHELIDDLRSTWEGRLFEWFAMGQVVPQIHRTPAGWLVEMDDLRYGLPGRAEHGLWGIRVELDAEGRPRAPVERFRREVSASAGTLLRQIWRQTFPPA